MQYRSPWPDLEIPRATLHDLIFATLTDDERDLVAFDHEETGEVLTFGQVSDQVDALATWLAARGLGTGDVVAIALPNMPAWGPAFHGVLRAGATVTPVNVASAPDEVAGQLRLTRARLVITSTAVLPGIREAAAQVDGTTLLVVGEGAADGEATWDEVLATEPHPPVLDIDPEVDIACLPVSSGTSGMPKAVMLTHTNLIANLVQFSEPIKPIGDGNSIVAFLPYSHIFGLTANLNLGLRWRYPQYTMSSFQGNLLLRIVATRRPTFCLIVPSIANFLARSSATSKVDWSCIKVFICGAAPLDEAVGQALRERTGALVVQGFGMTEMGPVTHVGPLEPSDVPVDTLGLPIPNVTFRVVDPDTGLDVEPPAPGEWSAPGELWLQGPNRMAGYLDDEANTAEAIDADGWLHTGDLAVVDDRGVAKVVDRIKELIKRRGLQIAPAELEAHLVQHPDVVDAAVVGVGAQAGDQVPHALLVLREGADPLEAPDAVLDWLNAQVASYKRVPSATVVGALPRSAAGKLVRRELRPVGR